MTGSEFYTVVRDSVKSTADRPVLTWVGVAESAAFEIDGIGGVTFLDRSDALAYVQAEMAGGVPPGTFSEPSEAGPGVMAGGGAVYLPASGGSPQTMSGELLEFGGDARRATFHGANGAQAQVKARIVDGVLQVEIITSGSVRVTTIGGRS